MTGSSSPPPVGVVGMLFTDIEGSTAQAARLGPDWSEVLSQHHQIIGDAITAEGGYVEVVEGDAFFAAFGDPSAAARAAVAAQRALASHVWPAGVGALQVRMGLHVGFVERADTGYVGLEVHRAARVGAAAHGGQLLLTAAAREMLGERFAADYLGAFRLKDFPSSVGLYCAVIDGRGASAFPPPRTLDARPTNLPAGLPSLVGRDRDLDEIVQALRGGRERIITLTGQGGAGKTSLALVAGARLLEDHPGGVWWVDLSQVTRAEQLLDTVAAAVGADREVDAGALEALTGRLRASGKVLLILDNLEHLAAAWSQVGQLLDCLPDLHVLCTSRMSLRLKSERVIGLHGLDDEAALALVEQVVTRRGGVWSPTPEDRQALLEVIGLLDGLPLALELAGARLALLSPQQLRERLRSSGDLLKDDSLPERQRSLGAIADWTLSQLPDPPCRLFSRLGAFAEPAELEEIELVTGGDGLDVLEGLSSLLDAALVHRLEQGDGKIRFGLPEALRQIASQRLDAAPDGERWRLAHAERQLDLLRAGVFATRADEQAAKAALPEGRGALRWAQRVGHPVATELAARVGNWLSAAGHLREAVEVLHPLFKSRPDAAGLRSLIYRAQGVLISLSGDTEEGVRLIELALASADDDYAVLECIQLRGMVQLFGGRLEPAVEDHRQATRMARMLDPVALATALVNEAQAMIAIEDLSAAASLLDEARRVGEPVQAAGLRAIDSLEGDLAMAADRPGEALEPYARSLEAAQRGDEPLQILFDLRGMANALGALEYDEEAAEVLGLADRQAEDVGGRSDTAAHLQDDAPARAALDRLGPVTAQAARRRGHAVVPGRRVARACELARAATL